MAGLSGMLLVLDICPTQFKVAILLAVLGVIGLVGQLLMLRAIYLRKSKRMTWTMRLININSFFALSYLVLLTPIGKDIKRSFCSSTFVVTCHFKANRCCETFPECCETYPVCGETFPKTPFAVK